MRTGAEALNQRVNVKHLRGAQNGSSMRQMLRVGEQELRCEGVQLLPKRRPLVGRH